MKKKVILVNDHMINNYLKEELINAYNFDVRFIERDPRDIIETATSGLYDAIIMDGAVFPNGYFSHDELISFQNKFGLKEIDLDMKISGQYDEKSKGLTLRDILPKKNIDSDINNVQLGRNIGFGIYDKIREQEIKSGSKKRIPVIFYTARNIKNLFIAGLLDTQNTFYIKKPAFNKTIAEKLEEILSSNPKKQDTPSVSNIKLNDICPN